MSADGPGWEPRLPPPRGGRFKNPTYVYYSNRGGLHVPAPPVRSWPEGLENFGENLIRLGSAVKSLEESWATPGADSEFDSSTAQLASAYARAFRMAQPVLLSGEESFLALVPAELPAPLYAPDPETNLRQAHTAVHEAILGAQEIVALMDRLTEAETSDPSGTREVLHGHLGTLSDSTTAVGWELKAVCHEYRSEVALAGAPPTSLFDFGPGAVGLVVDLARAANHLRKARREWYRLEQRLRSARGAATDVGRS